MKKTLTIALLALAAHAHAHAADPTFSAITITGTAALPATTTVSGTAFGGAAWLNTGTAAGTVAAGDASRIVNAVQVGGTTTNLTATGSLTVNGNTTLGDASGDKLTINAGTVTAPNATGTTGAASVMTRQLSESNSLFEMGTVQRVVNCSNLYKDADGSNFSSINDGGSLAVLASGTGLGGYAKARILERINSAQASGSAVFFSQPWTIGIVGIFSQGSTDNPTVARMLVGQQWNAVPPLAGNDALTSKGWGVEIMPAVAQQRPIRIIYHNGTSYATSGTVGFITASVAPEFTLLLENVGDGTMRVYGVAGGPGQRPSYTPILTQTGGPTGGVAPNHGSLTASCVAPSGTSAGTSASLRILNVTLQIGELKK